MPKWPCKGDLTLLQILEPWALLRIGDPGTHSILLSAHLRRFCSRYRLTENGDRCQCSRCQSGRMLGSQSMSLKPTRQCQRQAAWWTWNERRYRRTSLHKNQNDTTRKLQFKVGFSFYKLHEKKWIFFLLLWNWKSNQDASTMIVFYYCYPHVRTALEHNWTWCVSQCAQYLLHIVFYAALCL
jgi:hypothetical protein